MLSLAIDTSSHLSAACIFDGNRQATVFEDSRDIGRGHAEILMEQIDACLTGAECDYRDLDRVIVSRGPGSFTGVRVGMAAARGLSLALKIPCIGISTLEAAELAGFETGFQGGLITVLDAKREQLYCRNSLTRHSWLGTANTVFDKITDDIVGVCGSGAADVIAATGTPLEHVHSLHAAPIECYAVLGSRAEAENNPPEPLYLRAADAKPQSGLGVLRKAY